MASPVLPASSLQEADDGHEAASPRRASRRGEGDQEAGSGAAHGETRRRDAGGQDFVRQRCGVDRIPGLAAVPASETDYQKVGSRPVVKGGGTIAVGGVDE